MKKINLLKMLVLAFCLLMVFSQLVWADKGEDPLLRSKVKFINPEDAFTLFAFMNYTGYDDENYNAYHPVRRAIRDELQARQPAISRPNYFRDFGSYTMLEADMAGFIGWLGQPPNFKLDPKMKAKANMIYHGDLVNLDRQLTEFYQKADIGSLYEKYQPIFEKEIKGQEDKVYSILSRIVSHFNLDLSQMRDFEIYINLQDMYYRGYMFDFLKVDTNTQRPYLLHIGPQPGGELNMINIAHEFSHVFVSPIVQSELSEYKKLLLALTMEYGSSSNPDYASWDKIVDESFVRAMSGWAIDQGLAYAQGEVQAGFVMTEYIYKRINDFQAKPTLVFQDWVLQVMSDFADQIHDFGDTPLGGDDKGYEAGYDEGFQAGYEEGLAEGSTTGGDLIIEDRALYKVREAQSLVPVDKDWTLTFDLDLDLSTIQEKNIYISHSSGQIHPVFCLVDRDQGVTTLHLFPARDYEPGETYTLWIKDIKADNGKSLSQWTLMDFSIQGP